MRLVVAALLLLLSGCYTTANAQGVHLEDLGVSTASSAKGVAVTWRELMSTHSTGAAKSTADRCRNLPGLWWIARGRLAL